MRLGGVPSPNPNLYPYSQPGTTASLTAPRTTGSTSWSRWARNPNPNRPYPEPGPVTLTLTVTLTPLTSLSPNPHPQPNPHPNPNPNPHPHPHPNPIALTLTLTLTIEREPGQAARRPRGRVGRRSPRGDRLRHTVAPWSAQWHSHAGLAMKPLCHKILAKEVFILY